MKTFPDKILDRWPDAAAAAIGVLLAGAVLFTFRDYGISWDDELHIPYGHMLLAYYASGFQDRSAFAFLNLFLYGGFFDLTATALNSVSPFSEIDTRHLLGGLFFLVGLVGAWRLTRLIAGPRAAMIAVICLATTPLLYGHSFINPKDAPFAWLTVWVGYYCCRAFAEKGRPSRGTVVGLGVCLGLALGTRIIALALIAEIGLLLAVAACSSVWARGGAGWRALAQEGWAITRPFTFAAPIAVVLMAVFWPWSVLAPGNIVAALRLFADLYWHPAMLWNGTIVQANALPRSYLILLLGVQLPVYVLLGLTVFVLAGIARARAWSRATFAAPVFLMYLFVCLTAFVPLLAFIVARPTAYNGVRHFLFVVPQLVILAAIGLDRAVAYLAGRRRGLALAFGGLIFLSAGQQALIMARLHPYQYLAFNSLTGGVAGAYGRFELDYWGTSYREATRGLVDYLEESGNTAREENLRVFVCGGNLSVGYYLPPYLAITDTAAEADFVIGGDLTNPRCADLPVQGPKVVEVKRLGAVLGYVMDVRAGRAAMKGRGLDS